jgi:predicted Zn-dependent peptidase
VTARLRRIEGAPVVAVRLLLAGGARSETIPGQALLTGRLLTEGTRRRSWDRIAADAEGRGMILASFGGYETHGLSIDALAGDWQLALEWIAELLFESVFPEERLRWLARHEREPDENPPLGIILCTGKKSGADRTAGTGQKRHPCRGISHRATAA